MLYTKYAQTLLVSIAIISPLSTERSGINYKSWSDTRKERRREDRSQPTHGARQRPPTTVEQEKILYRYILSIFGLTPVILQTSRLSVFGVWCGSGHITDFTNSCYEVKYHQGVTSPLTRHHVDRRKL